MCYFYYLGLSDVSGLCEMLVLVRGSASAWLPEPPGFRCTNGGSMTLQGAPGLSHAGSHMNPRLP